MNALSPVLKFVALSLLVGFVSMLLQRQALIDWYPMLNKSSLTPPGILFSIVWPVLYVLMGVSAGLVKSTHLFGAWLPMLLFYVQLLFNLLWSLCFFYLRMPMLGFVVLAGLFVVVVAYVISCYAVRPTAAYLNVPYLLWLLFALYLNGYVMICN